MYRCVSIVHRQIPMNMYKRERERERERERDRVIETYYNVGM